MQGLAYDARMSIRVEFYGIARQRAGISALSLEAPARGLPLKDLLSELAQQLPHFAGACLANGELHRTLAANLDGNQFISDPATQIGDGQCLLILSADAGG